jgi:hypothetical protein
VVGDIANAAALPVWTATAVQPSIRLSPDPAEVASGSSVQILCLGTAGFTGAKVYHWTTPGDYGSLDDGRGNAGTEFDSDSATIAYRAYQGIKTAQRETVSAAAYLVRGADRVKLGEAGATVNIAPESSGGRKAYMQVVEHGPYVTKRGKDWYAEYYVQVVASWRGEDWGTQTIRHMPEFSPPDDRFEYYYSSGQTQTREELISEYGRNVWNLGEGEVGVAIYQNVCLHEDDRGYQEALDFLNLRLPEWKTWLYSLPEYQNAVNWWLEIP